MFTAAALLLAFVALFLFLLKRFSSDTPQNYWSRHSIPFVDTDALGLSQFGQHSVFERYDIEIAKYKEMKRRGHKEFAGIFENGVPLLYVYGADLMEQIFVKDFMSCVNRRLNSAELSCPVGRKALFHAKNQEWKDIRSAINPMFTTGKIREMCPMILESGQHLIHLLDEAVGDKLDIRPILHRFTADISVKIIFGIESGCYEEPPSGFFPWVRKLHPQFSSIQLWKWRLILRYPWTANIFKVPAFNPAAVEYFRTVLRQCRKNLEKGQNTNCNTFTDRMTMLANSGKDDGEEQEESEAGTGSVNTALVHNNSKFVPSEEHMVGSALSIFIAQTSNMLEAFACIIYELAMNPEVQENTYREIQVLVNNEANPSTDSILKLDYLNKVVNELFRKYGIMHLERRTNAEIKLSKYNVTIPKNTQIVVPVHAIQHDEDIYPNSKKFDPERFSPENIKKRHPYAYIPFGAGPRNCIAYRVAKAELKITLVQILRKFKFTPCKETPEAYALGSQLLVNVKHRF